MDGDVYHLGQNGQNTGPFTLAQVQDMWRSGAASAGTLYWQPGMAEWQPLGQIVSKLGQPPSLPDPSSSVPGSPPAPVPVPKVDYLTRTVPTGTPTTSGLAIASLILGLVSVVLSVLSGLAAIICGHMALGQIKRSAGQIAGRGMAITGLIFGYFFTLLFACFFLIGLALPIYSAIQQRGNATRDLADAKKIVAAIDVYEGDHEGKTPPDLDALVPKYLPDNSLLVGRQQPNEDAGYDYLVPNQDGKALDPRTAVLRGRSALRNGKHVFAYADGSCEVKSEE